MINTLGKLYFAIAAVALGAAVGYYALVGDRAGTVLLYALVVAAALAGLAAAGSGVKDRAPYVADPDSVPDTVAVTRSVHTGPASWPIVMATAAGIVALGLSFGAPILVVGLVGMAVAGAVWLGQAWRDHPSWNPRAGAWVQDRAVRPILVPVGALALVAGIVVCVSRVLLAVDEHAAVAIALLVAILTLAGFWFVASQPRTGRTILTLLGGFAALSLVSAGVAGAAKGEREFEPAAEPPTNEFRLVAHNTSFDKDALQVPVGKFVVRFVNKDSGTYHNVGIYTEKQGGAPVAESEPIRGVGKKTYTFDVKQPGTYAFRCDFHANMVGTLTVTP